MKNILSQLVAAFLVFVVCAEGLELAPSISPFAHEASAAPSKQPTNMWSSRAYGIGFPISGVTVTYQDDVRSYYGSEKNFRSIYRLGYSICAIRGGSILFCDWASSCVTNSKGWIGCTPLKNMVQCANDALCPDFTICPSSGAPTICRPIGSEVMCDNQLFCPNSMICAQRSSDLQYVCEVPEGLAASPKSLTNGGCEGMGNVASRLISTTETFNLTYAYEGVVMVAPGTSVCNGMTVASRFSFEAQRPGKYIFTFSMPSCPYAVMIVSGIDGCSQGLNASSCDSIQSVEMPFRAKRIIHIGAHHGLRCPPASTISLTVEFVDQALHSRVPIYLYSSIPVFLVVALLLLQIRVPADLLSLWFFSACEISGTLIYLLFANFESAVLFWLMIAFLIINLCALMAMERISLLKDVQFILSKPDLSNFPVCPFPSNVQLDLSGLPTDDRLQEVWRLPGYLFIVVFQIVKLAVKALAWILVWPLNALLRISWVLLNLASVPIMLVGLLIAFIGLMVCKWFVLNPCWFIGRGILLGMHSRHADVRQINAVILTSVAFQSIPMFILVLINGLKTGQTSDVTFIYAILGSSLMLASTLYYVAFTMGVLRRRTWEGLLTHNRFGLKVAAQPTSTPETTETTTTSNNQQHLRYAAQHRYQESSSFQNFSSPPKPAPRVVVLDELESLPSSLRSSHNRTDRPDGTGTLVLGETEQDDDLAEPSWMNPTRRPQANGSSVFSSNSSRRPQEHSENAVNIECRICFSPSDRNQVLNCGHVMCKECVTKIKRDSNVCPFCKAPIRTAINLFI